MHALWIGGPPGAGKTTVARRLARRHGLRLHSADTRTWAHRDRALAAGHPAAARFEALPPAARWAAPPAELRAMSLHDERGPMVLDDLRALPSTPLTVVEGTPVTPAIAGEPAVWLLPTADVQEARLAARGLNPGTATLYRLLSDEIVRAVRAHGGRVVVVDGSRDVEQTLQEVERVFAAALRAGPTATTADERRALLREANDAVVAQHRAFAARPWAPPDALTAVRSFACECGSPACVADVDLPVDVAGAQPVLAAGHPPW